jgi:hypothetical protein
MLGINEYLKIANKFFYKKERGVTTTEDKDGRSKQLSHEIVLILAMVCYCGRQILELSIRQISKYLNCPTSAVRYYLTIQEDSIAQMNHILVDTIALKSSQNKNIIEY